MHTRTKYLYTALFITFVFSSFNSHAQDATTNRINGMAEFLYDRANDNLVYILQQDIKANTLMKCYMPQTYAFATSSNLNLLLQSGPEVWKKSVELDLRNFGAQLILKNTSPTVVKQWLGQINDQYIEATQRIAIVYKGTPYAVNIQHKDAPKELTALINSIYDDFNLARDNISAIVKNLETQPKSQCPNNNAYASIGLILQRVGEAIEDLQNQIAKLDKTEIVYSDKSVQTESIGRTLYDTVLTLKSTNEDLDSYHGRIQEIRQEASLVVQVFLLDQLIRESIQANKNPLLPADDFNKYDRFNEYALSFALLTEAQSSEQVKAIMQELTLPPVSFAVKRQRGGRKTMLTAYFGMQGGVESPDNELKKEFGGLSVPVGLEYSYGLNNDFLDGAFSIMVAPLDFAHPINQIINNQEAAVEFQDIFNPGIYLSFGFARVPVVLGVGYSRGPTVTQIEQANSGRYFGFIALDMPLFNFYR